MQKFSSTNSTLENGNPSAKFDYAANWVLVTSGSATVILGVLVLLLLRRRPCKRADHILIGGYASAALMSAIGRILLGANRLQESEQAKRLIKPFYCLLRANYILSSISSGTTFVLIFLLSLERVLYFNGSLWHKKLFSRRRTKLIVFLSFIPGTLDYAASLAVAFYKSDHLVSPMCYRLQIIGRALYLIDVFWCTTLLLFTLADYVLSYVYLVRKRLAAEGLQCIRINRERRILNSLALIFLITFTMELVPWIIYLFNSLHVKSIHALHVAYILDTWFLPVYTFLFLIIHPDLSAQLMKPLESIWHLNFCRADGKVATVYAG